MSSSLTTLAATVSSTGISAPTMDQILSFLQGRFQSIYGADTYLGADSQDGEWLGVIAQAVHDCNDMAVFVYNQFSPATAIGAGLSSVIKINGLQREQASNSTTIVTIIGQAGTSLTNCLVGDNVNLGTQWSVAGGTTIPSSGTVQATVTCTAEGNITVPPNSLTVILTPVPGWQSVTNGTNPVSLGQPVEDDAQARQRQSVSTSIPAQTVLASIKGGIANLPGVSNVAVYKNDSGSVDSNGIPAHAISVVVEGGNAVTIAQTIALYKTPGVPTYGNTTETVYDSIGVPSTINFFVLEEVYFAVLVQLNPLEGYTTNGESQIQQSVAYQISNLSIGESSYCGRLWGPANLSGDAATNATGVLQSTLDTVSATYSLSVPYGIAQARVDLMVTTAAAVAGANTITVGQGSLYNVGEIIFISLVGGSVLQATVTNVSGNTLTFSPAIPSTNSVAIGAIVYAIADIVVAFNETAIATPGYVLVIAL